jgi:C6 transcription factor Pro1
MNNGEEERAVSNSLKEIVKHTSRRKATNQASKQGDTVQIKPKPACRSSQTFPFGPELSSCPDDDDVLQESSTVRIKNV